jgi:RNA polymerase sigma-70 factor (ECF subfamily)
VTTQRQKVVALHRSSASSSGRITVSDEALVAGVGVGDASALGALYDRHSEAVRRFVARLTRRVADDVDDIVHDTFLTASGAAAAFRGGSTVRTWLLGIAANVVRHAIRGRVRRRALVLAASDVDPHPAPTPEDGARAIELRERIAEAVAELPHDLRVAFVMADLEDVSGAEAARVLGIPEGTFFRRCHEARRALRASLEGIR